MLPLTLYHSVQLFIVFHSSASPLIAIIPIFSEGLLLVLGCWSWALSQVYLDCQEKGLHSLCVCVHVCMVGTVQDIQAHRLDRIDGSHHVLGKHWFSFLPNSFDNEPIRVKEGRDGVRATRKVPSGSGYLLSSANGDHTVHSTDIIQVKSTLTHHVTDSMDQKLHHSLLQQMHTIDVRCFNDVRSRQERGSEPLDAGELFLFLFD